MKIIEQKFNLVIPKNIKQIFKFGKKQFGDRMLKLLKTKKIASIRWQALGMSELELSEISNYLKTICKNEVLILIENNIELSVQLKLDGVHLTGGQNLVKKAKSILSKHQVIGAFCGSSKHSGLVAAENGANYIAFKADYQSVNTKGKYVELFKWWSEFIEIPIMAECASDCLISGRIWKDCDFFSLSDNIWCSETSIEKYLQPTEAKY